MTQYLVAIYRPDDFDPSGADKSMEHDSDALNGEVEAKGGGLFAGGLRPPSDASSLQAQPDGQVLITGGAIPRDQGEHLRSFNRGSR